MKPVQTTGTLSSSPHTPRSTVYRCHTETARPPGQPTGQPRNGREIRVQGAGMKPAGKPASAGPWNDRIHSPGWNEMLLTISVFDETPNISCPQGSRFAKVYSGSSERFPGGGGVKLPPG